MRALLLLYAFAAPWCFGLLTLGDVNIGITDILMPVATAAIVTRIRVPLTGVQCALLACGAAAVCSWPAVLATEHAGIVILKTARLWGLLAPAVLLTLVPTQAGDLKRYLTAFLSGGVLSLILGIAGFFLGWEFTAARQSWDFGDGGPVSRAGGVFLDTSAYGHLLASWCVIAFAAMRVLGGRAIRFLIVCVAVPVTALALAVSLSRSAIVHLVAAGTAAVVVPTMGPARWKRIAAAGLLFALPALLLAWAPDDTMAAVVRDRVVETYTGLSLASDLLDGATSGRLTNWAGAMSAWIDHPLLGTGYKALIPLYDVCGDNTFVLALAETGLLGLFAVIALFGWFFRDAMRKLHAGSPPGRILLIVWSGQAMHAFTVDTMTFFGSMTGVLMLSVLLSQQAETATV